MGFAENLYSREHLIGGASVPLVVLPSIRGRNRRSDPDGTHTAPFFSSLLAKTLILNVSPVGALTITFSSNDYLQAISTINASSPANLKAEDEDGFLRIINLNQGGQNYIKVTGGTGPTILGFDVDPFPGSASFAGEIALSASGGKNQANPQGTTLIAKNEDLTSAIVNRAVAGSQLALQRLLWEFDREVLVVETRSLATRTTGGTTYFYVNDPTVRIPLKAYGITVSNPTVAQLAPMFGVQDANGGDIFGATNPQRVDGGYYIDADATPTWTPNNAAPFTAYGTPDGKSIFGSTVWQKTKHVAIAITEIRGNVLRCTGAQFQTKLVQPGDTLLIQGSTNTIPFSHNGEFVVDRVISEEAVSVRPKGFNEELVFSGEQKPTSLNAVAAEGAVHGTAMVPVGFFIPGKYVAFSLRNALAGTNQLRFVVAKRLRDMEITTLARELGGDANSIFTTLLAHINPTTLGAHSDYNVSVTSSSLFNWADGVSAYPASPFTLQLLLRNIVSSVASFNGGSSGIRKIGGETLSGSPRGLTSGTLYSQLVALLGYLNNHFTGAADRHTASVIDYAGGANWADGTTNPAASVETQLDKIITDLNRTSAPDGAIKIGALAYGNLPVGTIRGQLNNIDDNAARKNLANIFTASQTFRGPSSPETTAALITDSGPTARKLLWEMLMGSGVKARFYSSAIGSGATQNVYGTPGFEITINARWDGTNWNKDIANGNTPSQRLVLTDFSFLNYHRAQNLDTAWADNVWLARFSTDNFGPSMSFLGQILLGGSIMTTGVDAAMPRIVTQVAPRAATNNRTLLWESRKNAADTSYGNFRIYQNASPSGTMIEFTTNAWWDSSLAPASMVWKRDASGEGSFLYELWAGYITTYYQGGAASWTDARTFGVAGAGWRYDVRMRIDGGFQSALAPAATGIGDYSGVLAEKNLIRAWGIIKFGVATPLIMEGFGLAWSGAIAYAGTTALEITLGHTFSSIQDYMVLPIVLDAGAAAPFVCEVTRIDGNTFQVHIALSTTGANQTLTTWGAGTFYFGFAVLGKIL